MHSEWRKLQKNARKTLDTFKRREKEFKSNLDNVFDTDHANALQTIKLEEDRVYILNRESQGGKVAS